MVCLSTEFRISAQLIFSVTRIFVDEQWRKNWNAKSAINFGGKLYSF